MIDPAQIVKKEPSTSQRSFEKGRLDLAMNRVSRELVREKRDYDQQAVNLTWQYKNGRKHFHDRQGEFVCQVLFDGREHLRKYI